MTSLLATAHNSTSTLSEVEPGVLGFLVVAALAIALVFLLRSMNKHLRKVGPKPVEPLEFESPEEDAGDVPAGAVPGEVLRED